MDGILCETVLTIIISNQPNYAKEILHVAISLLESVSYTGLSQAREFQYN